MACLCSRFAAARKLLFIGVIVAAVTLSAGAAHWAFEPIRPLEPPSIHQKAWIKTPIDRFILARLESVRLKPSPSATPEQLVRRLTLGLTGLPPAPEVIASFVSDPSPAAYERLVDRLLASPHYGERWARHWLDLARYAETDGFEHDAIRPHSWRYRDYVIASLNEDKPYDRFIREQLAGDELWPNQPEALIATGFNLLGPDMVDSADQTQRRLNTLNDMTDTAASVFLGLTFGCARCHDHKFEPFTQRDYFSLQAFFAGAEFHREEAVPTAEQRAAYEVAIAEYEALTKVQRDQIQQIEAPVRERLFAEKLARLSEDAQLAHQTPRERRTAEQEGAVQETLPQVKVTDTEVLEAIPAEVRAHRAAIEAEIKMAPKPPPLPRAMVLRNRNGPAAPKTWILARGDYNHPREEVQSGFPLVLASFHPLPDSPSSMSSPRQRLADWIASPGNPLTARVMVNRIWQHHFGRGLVSTPSDFGTRGQAPSHPELLDWLAGEFIRGGWRWKQVHKLILMSSVYQQSSVPGSAALAVDPENKLFSRRSHVRLEGEVIRDSLLAISGRLNSHMGGAGVSPPIPADIAKTSGNWTVTPDAGQHRRRSVYVFARRNLRFPFLEVFDGPDSNLTCPERGRSTTAPQALTMLNSEEVVRAADATAVRIRGDAFGHGSQVNRAFQLILGRKPNRRESRLAVEFLRSAPLTELCRALFNLNAFVYVE